MEGRGLRGSCAGCSRGASTVPGDQPELLQGRCADRRAKERARAQRWLQEGCRDTRGSAQALRKTASCFAARRCCLSLAHRAVMRAVTAAADGQTRIVAGLKEADNGPKPKSEGEEDGEHAPHLHLMVHESCGERRTGGWSASGIIDASRAGTEFEGFDGRQKGLFL